MEEGSHILHAINVTGKDITQIIVLTMRRIQKKKKGTPNKCKRVRKQTITKKCKKRRNNSWRLTRLRHWTWKEGSVIVMRVPC